MLLYGPPKIGKTTAGVSAPGPVLHLNAEGPNAVAFARERHGDEKVREVVVDGAQTMNDVLLYLRNNPPERTVVLDTVSAIFGVLLEDKAGRGKPSLPMYGDVTTAIERFVREVRDMPVNMILLAHETPIKDESTGVIERLPYTGTNNPALGGKLMAWVDVIAYCGRVVNEKGERYCATLVDASGRRGGDRTGRLGRDRDLDLSEWLTIATAPTVTQIEKKAA